MRSKTSPCWDGLHQEAYQPKLGASQLSWDVHTGERAPPLIFTLGTSHRVLSVGESPKLKSILAARIFEEMGATTAPEVTEMKVSLLAVL